MTVTLYRNLSETIRANKTLTTISTLTGTLRESTSILDPEIVIAASAASLSSANYAYIPDFGRYYFIREITSVRDGLTRLTMHVDVLSTWRVPMGECAAIITRQESQWNLYLNDGSLRAYQDPNVYTVPFPTGFSGSSFVLAVAGG